MTLQNVKILTTSNKENYEQQNSAELNATDNNKSLLATIDRTAKMLRGRKVEQPTLLLIVELHLKGYSTDHVVVWTIHVCV